MATSEPVWWLANYEPDTGKFTLSDVVVGNQDPAIVLGQPLHERARVLDIPAW